DMGRFESLQAQAMIADLAGHDSAALAQAQAVRSHRAVAECLSATTTLWLPAYGAGAAVLAGLGAWFIGRARARKEAAVADRLPPRHD
ncbi:hypothetical protein ACWHA1_41875, partial [Streptomyces decoyicus]